MQVKLCNASLFLSIFSSKHKNKLAWNGRQEKKWWIYEKAGTERVEREKEGEEEKSGNKKGWKEKTCEKGKGWKEKIGEREKSGKRKRAGREKERKRERMLRPND